MILANIKINSVVKRIVTGFVLGSLFWLSFSYLSPIYFSFVLLAIMMHILFFEWTNFFDTRQPIFWVLMPFYLILPFTLLILLNHYAEYRSLLFILFVLVSSFDTGSYIAGNFFGKTLIAPSVSPKKTWEGALGGYIAACIGLIFVAHELAIHQPYWFFFLFALVVCSLSLAGDLFESYLKRCAKIKDSGSILPGHGGFLDRFDGILFAAFFFFIFRKTLVVFFLTVS